MCVNYSQPIKKTMLLNLNNQPNLGISNTHNRSINEISFTGNLSSITEKELTNCKGIIAEAAANVLMFTYNPHMLLLKLFFKNFRTSNFQRVMLERLESELKVSNPRIKEELLESSDGKLTSFLYRASGVYSNHLLRHQSIGGDIGRVAASINDVERTRALGFGFLEKTDEIRKLGKTINVI